MKKRMLAALLLSALLFTLSGCGEKSLLHKKEPVSLTFWHVYGEQAGSPMDLLVQEFNRTVGQELGVQVKVTGTSSASKIGGYLKEAQSGGQEVQEMPDLFTCHISDATALGEENLVDWHDWFTEEELADFVPGFLDDGTVEDGRLLVFPVSKSTQLLMCNGSGFARFSDATGVRYDDLATWEGFYDAAGKFYDWSGKPFCALDYPIRAVELCAMERGSGDFYTENGWYDTDNAVFKESWMQFARSLAQGHVVVSDLYSNTQVMTGDVVCGLGSSAAILYYNDTVTYPDNTQEPMNLHVLPMPKTAGADALMTQAGVGLCAYKTTEQKADAPEKTWTLRHMDETKNVGEAEMVTLAQKGMDYDRIRAKYDESKPAMEILSIFAKQKGVSVADYVSFLRTEAKKADGLSEAEARRSIELEDREAAVTAREAEQAAERQAAEQANAAANAAAQRRKADIDEFAREYPDVARNPDAIPKEVWDAVAAGSSLTVAYAKYTAKQAREEAERTRSAAQAAQQNIKNAARSTGSMQSAGQNAGGRDPFLEGWGE